MAAPHLDKELREPGQLHSQSISTGN
jgi:hypothetical protein